jgi:NitT/TauT family transport system permease protein
VAPALPSRWPARLGRGWLSVAGLASLLLLWQMAAVLLDSVLFPPPLAVLQRAAALYGSGEIYPDILASLRRILSGFALGSALGVTIGLVMGNFVSAQRVLEPFTELMRFVPSVAMITIAVIWFGIGETSKIFLIMHTTMFIVIINTAAGVRSITPNKLRAAQCLGASKRQIFFHVSIPATLPFILTGMRLAMGNSFTTVVAAEMIAADNGLGQMLWNGRLYMLIDDIFVALMTLAALGFVTDRLFRRVIHALSGRYGTIA